MLTRYRACFLRLYDGMDYLHRTRARLLLYFVTSFIFLSFLMQSSMLFAGWHDFVVTIPMTIALLSGMGASLMFLRKGRYLLAANLLIGFAAATVIAGLVRQPFMEIELSLTSYIYFIFPCIPMCAIFSTVSFLTVISILMALTNTALFIIMKSLPHEFSDKLVTIAFSNTLFAIGFLYLLSYLILKVFERSVELANQESEKNAQATGFITKVLMESSRKVVDAMSGMSEQSDRFSESAHDQSESMAGINTKIGEISGGIDRIAHNADGQSEGLDSLLRILDDLSEVIGQIDGAIRTSLEVTVRIADKARSGEEHLREMEEGIRKVNASSQEMTNIIAIINDISDKINLLSLNAAIEAARAGDAGRGFAVVADQISKLADDTGSSIKSIETLIRTNENEITRGLSGASRAVEVMKGIIEGVSAVSAAMQGITDFKDRQVETNRRVNENAASVKRRAEEITGATIEQKNAVAEIVRAMSVMSERSQYSTAHAVKMAYDSKDLVDLVDELKKKLEDYSERI
jgi:methyl-accepting chemotaxis protein